MCVIFVATKVRPEPDMLDDGFQSNPYGGGIAWRERNKVLFSKGLDLKDLKQLAATVPLPFVVHFRIPTAGGDCDELCHPFPLGAEASTELKGATRRGVVFHNGHWHQWGSRMQEALIHLHRKAPHGPWSDSRAMAFLAYYYGHEFLDLLDEKIVLFTPRDLKILGKGWVQDRGIDCSNTQWRWRGNYTSYGGTWTTQDGWTTAKKATTSTLTDAEKAALRSRLDAHAKSRNNGQRTYLTEEYGDVQKALAPARRCIGAGCSNILLSSQTEFCVNCQHEIDRGIQEAWLAREALGGD